MRHTFTELLELATTESGGVDAPSRATIVKELLHYDILRALAASDIARRVVFQGGTALRLCYGGQRYSEDLDFVCGSDAHEPFVLDDMTTVLRQQMRERYDLAVEVHPPGDAKSFDHVGVTIKRWRYHIVIPGFAAAQRIHVEFCNVPAYTAEPVLLQPRYAFLDESYGGIVLGAESEREILADKMVALAGRNHLKARDVWDIRWLTQRGQHVDLALVRRKAADYGLADLPAKLQAAAAQLRSPAASRSFVDEMQRFVASALIDAIVHEHPPGNSWLQHAAQTAETTARQLPL